VLGVVARGADYPGKLFILLLSKQCVIRTRSRITNKMPLPQGKLFGGNWCVDELINFEEPNSGLEELSFNPVSQLRKISMRSRYLNNAVSLIEQSIKK